MKDSKSQLQTLRSKIESGKRGGDEEDRALLLRFSDRMALLRNEYSDHRHLKLLRHCTRMAEHGGSLEGALERQADAEKLVRWINAEYDNPNTNVDYRTALRVFGRRVTDGDDIPDSLAWVSTTMPKSYDPRPDPADMITKEEADAMADACTSSRDAAAIMMAFDAGPRPGELWDLRVGDVSDLPEGWAIRVDGKTGQRTVYLNLSVPHVSRWLTDHPASDDPHAHLWTKIGSAERPSYTYFLKLFRKAAERAGVKKTPTPRNFRRSNATFLAKRGANETLINERQGREPGSKETARYVAMFGENQAKQYAKLMGEEVQGEEFDKVAPRSCPRCDHKTPRDRPHCVFCGQILDAVALQEQREKDREARRDFFRLAAERPGMMDRLEKLRDLMDLFEEDPELLEKMQAFVGELED